MILTRNCEPSFCVQWQKQFAINATDYQNCSPSYEIAPESKIQCVRRCSVAWQSYHPVSDTQNIWMISAISSITPLTPPTAPIRPFTLCINWFFVSFPVSPNGAQSN